MPKGSIRNIRGNQPGGQDSNPASAAAGQNNNRSTPVSHGKPTADSVNENMLNGRQRSQYLEMQRNLQRMQGEDPQQLMKKARDLIISNPQQSQQTMQQFMSSMGPMLNQKQKDMLKRLLEK